MLKQSTSINLQNKLFCLLERYPEEMREVIMTVGDKDSAHAAAFFANEVARLETVSPSQRAEAILAYVETIWMAGFEAGRERSR